MASAGALGWPMDPQDAADRLAALRADIATSYGVGGDLRRQVRKIRRTLPRYELRQAEDLVRVEAELAEREAGAEIDSAAFERAETALQMHLEGLDTLARRRGFALDIATSVIVNVVIGVGVIAAFWALLSAG